MVKDYLLFGFPFKDRVLCILDFNLEVVSNNQALMLSSH
jgi:hypothetical protein